MLARLRKAAENKDSGFTLIELLVVMIIIGILAAIAIPAFLSQRAKARDTSTKADVSTLGKEVATYFVDGADGAVTVAVASGNATISIAGAAQPNPVKLSKGTVAPGTGSASGTTSQNWCVALTNPAGSAGSQTWSYSAANGLAANAC